MSPYKFGLIPFSMWVLIDSISVDVLPVAAIVSIRCIRISNDQTLTEKRNEQKVSIFTAHLIHSTVILDKLPATLVSGLHEMCQCSTPTHQSVDDELMSFIAPAYWKLIERRSGNRLTRQNYRKITYKNRKYFIGGTQTKFILF